jgi:predicted ATP-dependent endonuclease of OLD family
MRVPSFLVENQRGLSRAECTALPKVMIIAGPNGAGKSTLLSAIRDRTGYSNVVYVGPHRAMRRQNVQQRHLLSRPLSMEEIYSSQSLTNYDGIRLMDGARDPWGHDDSASYLKHALCQIEIDRQQAITTRFDREGSIPAGTLVDPWRPLRELAAHLLPHLIFERIDASNRDQVRVLWKVHRTSTLVDIDDLSSGEKSIVQMFYPLVEREIKALVKEIDSGPQAVARPEACVMIDEPELHLHPNLQLKVLDYLRVITSGKPLQVIVATHSPTIVEQATFDELFLLRPVELTPAGDNQLIQLADDEERLRVLRDLFGGTSNLTSMQHVLVVEGTNELGRSVPDRKIYRAIHAGFDSMTVVAGGGKSQCLQLRDALAGALSTFSANLKVVALLDRDLQATPTASDVFVLPVSMIENLLLDPDALWEALQSVIEKTPFATKDDLARALDGCIDELFEDELSRHVAATIGAHHFHPPSERSEITSAAEAFAKDVVEACSAVAITAAEDTARAALAALARDHRRREMYHGKRVLDDFYKRALHRTGMQKGIFKFEAARHARTRKSVKQFFDGLMASLGVA